MLNLNSKINDCVWNQWCINITPNKHAFEALFSSTRNFILEMIIRV